MIKGYELIEKMYSDNYDEYEDTRLYSTGDSELDDLLERAFCEGYEYAQKEFAAYKSPISQKESRKIINEMNEMGYKGRSLGAVGKSWLKDSLGKIKSLGGSKEDVQRGIDIFKEEVRKNPRGGNPRMAQRANKATLYALKKGLK